MQEQRFSGAQRAAVHRAAVAAEELTGGFYCIPEREWSRFPYDIATLSEGPGPDRQVFADVVRTVRPASSPGRGPEQQLYRIRLRDDEILGAVGERLDTALFPLLLYVLTHELIHVVRFESGLAAYETDDPAARVLEEDRVHAITRKVLQPAENPALRSVMDACFAPTVCGAGVPVS